MALFQTKIGWKRPRKRENKSYCSVSFLPNASYKISKKYPKNSKYKKKYQYDNISSQNRLEKDVDGIK